MIPYRLCIKQSFNVEQQISVFKVLLVDGMSALLLSLAITDAAFF